MMGGYLSRVVTGGGLAAFLALPVFAGTATYKIDPRHGSAQFAVTHLMISKVRGEFHAVNGTVIVDDSDITKSSVEVTIDASTIDAKSVATYVTKAKEEGIVAHLMAIIPDSYFGALARGDLLQVLLVSILSGVVIARLGETGRKINTSSTCSRSPRASAPKKLSGMIPIRCGMMPSCLAAVT